MNSEPEKLQIKPYARLLTMLGEQLIKNEKVALIEIIKNSYDADADWVKIHFSNFGPNYNVLKNSKIIIEDNGEGMSEEVIKKQWLHPAAPGKKQRKQHTPRTTKGRVIQGEKGIGRYALLKLGRKIKVITRPSNDQHEYIVTYDFTNYDDEFTSYNGEDKNISLDDIDVLFEKRKAEVIVKKEIDLENGTATRDKFGTRIEISNLTTAWTEKKVIGVFNDIQKLRGAIPDKTEANQSISDFNVSIFHNDKLKNYGEEIQQKLSLLIDERAVFRIHGTYEEKKKRFNYYLNEKKKILNLEDLEGLSLYRKTIKEDFDFRKRTSDCGDFNFVFYVFDFNPSAPGKYKLEKDDKNLIKSHRIYLFRDGVRIYPYGDPDDDWLHIDQYRGTISAGDFLSNDQIMGKVNITHEHNPKLIDKTNREGLIEEGTSTTDFISLLQLFLTELRKGEYKRYIEKNKNNKNEIDVFKGNRVQQEIQKLRESVEGNSAAEQKLKATEKLYLAERRYLVKRAETTEELAGVGLSVEASYHDVFSFLEKVLRNLDDLIRNLHKDVDIKELEKELSALRGMVSFSVDQMRDVQIMFSSTKQRRKNTKVKEIVDKVVYIYQRLFKREGISCEVETIGSPLVAKTTDAVLLQLLINLFDNAIYWLNVKEPKNKEIRVTLDGQNRQLIFSDNGPGVNEEDKPYIFSPFYSGKGDDGRGLGLYIAQQLLDRHGYGIDLADNKLDELLPGANFVVSFIYEE